MPQKTLRFKIHQDGKVEETVEGFIGNTCNHVTENLENSLGEVIAKKRTTEAFISHQSKKLTKIQNDSNVSL